MSALWESPFFGVTLTILAYWAGCKIQKRTGLVICNGLVLAVMMIIAVLAVFDIPYAAYNAGGSLINLFLGPATVCLAVTIYAQIDLLKKNLLPILAGCAAGAVTSVLSIWGLCRLFGLDRTLTVSLLPKSVTTPIATAIAEGQGGIVSITVAAVIFTGILGNLCAPALARLFRVKDPVAAGLAIGACSHAMGTARALELGEDGGGHERPCHRPLRPRHHYFGAVLRRAGVTNESKRAPADGRGPLAHFIRRTAGRCIPGKARTWRQSASPTGRRPSGPLPCRGSAPHGSSSWP